MKVGDHREETAMKRLLVPAVVAAGFAAAVLASGSAAIASTGVAVDFGDCANSPDAATVPAGSPITLTDTGASATGNYGTAFHGYKSGVNTVTIAVTGGTTTAMPLVSAPPQYFGDPYFAWLTVLPDIALDPLAPRGSVLVTIDYTNTTGGEAVFPRQKGPAPALRALPLRPGGHLRSPMPDHRRQLIGRSKS
jgi:hypothetical protein